ncbi:hypothetical protein MXM51_01515 [Pantoea stewartii]|uniref:hypothetical protein n=1 Tax=Pantoea stewartii TaxID=66269 RepID=UPI002DB728DA|nr:hypothetical protein [Pantoea stewartii]MEB6533228.1 hypothetical protein [Pantoea stewartii]
MTQEEVSELSINELHRLAAMVVREASVFTPTDEWYLNGVMDGDFHPTMKNTHAMIVASALDMNICFGDRVVLVSEPAGGHSRTVSYEGKTIPARINAMRRAITLLAADYAQYI